MKFIKPKRKVTKVFLHCSASDREEHDDVSVIKEWHLKRGFRDVGYNNYIKKSGEIQSGRDMELTPAAQAGHNTGSIAICCGGLKDFTEAQMKSLKEFCLDINSQIKGVTFHGHREVEPNKTCPVFNYKKILNLDIDGSMIL